MSPTKTSLRGPSHTLESFSTSRGCISNSLRVVVEVLDEVSQVMKNLNSDVITPCYLKIMSIHRRQIK